MHVQPSSTMLSMRYSVSLPPRGPDGTHLIWVLTECSISRMSLTIRAENVCYPTPKDVNVLLMT